LSNKVKLCVLVDEGLRIESVEVYGQMGEVAMAVHDFVSDDDAANALVVGQNMHNTGCVEDMHDEAGSFCEKPWPMNTYLAE
jgi:hypothetical protein